MKYRVTALNFCLSQFEQSGPLRDFYYPDSDPELQVSESVPNVNSVSKAFDIGIETYRSVPGTVVLES